jgi:hypothetical protein
MKTRRVNEVDLKPGLLYKVTFDDCCVSGEFTSKFVGEVEGDLTFENGVKLWQSYACNYEEIETEDNPFF